MHGGAGIAQLAGGLRFLQAGGLSVGCGRTLFALCGVWTKGDVVRDVAVCEACWRALRGLASGLEPSLLACGFWLHRGFAGCGNGGQILPSWNAFSTWCILAVGGLLLWAPAATIVVVATDSLLFLSLRIGPLFAGFVPWRTASAFDARFVVFFLQLVHPGSPQMVP